MIHFVLIRSGETKYSKEKRYEGKVATGLTPRGKKQIERFKKEVLKYKPDIIFSSPTKRAKESAAILAKSLRKKVKVDSRLRELNFGFWEGKTANELIELEEVSFFHWLKGKPMRPKEGESISSLSKRIRSFIKDCRKKYDDKKIIIVTDGGPIRMLLVTLLKLPFSFLFQFRIDPGTITVLGDYRLTKQLIQINSPIPNRGIVPKGCV